MTDLPDEQSPQIDALPTDLHPILGPLPNEHERLLAIVLSSWRARGQWPVFDYVNRSLMVETNLDALEVVSRLPVVQGASPHIRYPLLFFERGQFADATQQVGLTIAGLFRAGAVLEADILVDVIGYLADEDGRLQPDPSQPVSLNVPIIDLIAHSRSLRGWRPEALADALGREPPTWGTVLGEGEAAARIRPSSDRLLPYRGVTKPEDYIARVIATMGAPSSRLPTVAPSPLGLAEALGYLDAVWRNRTNTPLLGRSQPTSVVRLGLPAASPDEFNGRLSALADVLDHMQITLTAEDETEAVATGERSLARLARYLRRELDGPAGNRGAVAVTTLRHIVRVRVTGQHSGLESDLAATFRALGIRYPPLDYGAAWDQVRVRATDAINAIRDELLASE